MTPETLKRCPKCHLELPLSAFNIYDIEKGTRYSYCRKCRSPMDKAYKDRKRRELLERRRKVALRDIEEEERMGYPSGCPLLYDERYPDPRETLRKTEDELKNRGWLGTE